MWPTWLTARLAWYIVVYMKWELSFYVLTYNINQMYIYETELDKGMKVAQMDNISKT